MRLVTFQVAEQRYALPAENVNELLRAVALAPLPRAARFVEGLVDVRGVVVPVLEIRSRFGLPAKPLSSSDYLVLARTAERLVALRVDRVLDLVDVADGDVESVTRQVPTARHVEGVARLPDGLAVIYDLSTFLDAADSAALREMEDQRVREATA